MHATTTPLTSCKYFTSQSLLHCHMYGSVIKLLNTSLSTHTHTGTHTHHKTKYFDHPKHPPTFSNPEFYAHTYKFVYTTRNLAVGIPSYPLKSNHPAPHTHIHTSGTHVFVLYNILPENAQHIILRKTNLHISVVFFLGFIWGKYCINMFFPWMERGVAAYGFRGNAAGAIALMMRWIWWAMPAQWLANKMFVDRASSV